MIREIPTINKKDRKTDKYIDIPKCDIESLSLDKSIDKSMIRDIRTSIPHVAEPDVVRHYTNLSSKNHHVDQDFYPLGSCTMKYNPKINDKIASNPNFTDMHPDQCEADIQGTLNLMYKLEKMLNSITGMNRTTLQPTAGSQGEFVGLLIMKKYHKLKKNDKKVVLIPESAHGTNPASVILSGYEVVQVKTNEEGCTDLEDLRSKVNEDVAGMMLTQPNTLGIFEKDILEISKLIHDVDGLMYMDGANLNALLSISRPADMGFDITHMNLHKTFSTPHGGGGPGAGPIGVVEKLVDFLPSPMIDKDENNKYFLNKNDSTSIGSIHSNFGNVGVLVRAYCYIKSLGDEGLRDVSRNAIINANYLKKRLSDYYDVPFFKNTMHEFVISAVNQKNKGLKALDIAKLILDKGYHAPTIYFPTNIPEAMMMEPTETESKDTLDSFADYLIYISENIDNKLTKFLESPSNTPVKRLNETKANRELNLNWQDELSDNK
ncbi:MAG: glycine dehydrogenase (aminomethyl-transferring) [Candidatus Marinimicrobia bacterium]|nr:glycine dehydrogenase (aminomethyl-transferring) [Candidatus Neomarinimicrobiota bacterium]